VNETESDVTIEVGTFHGSAEELSQFVGQTWLDSYRGKMVVPDWTPEYFEWQMPGPGGGNRDLLVCAREDSSLVGVLLGMPFPFWVLGEECAGCQASWLTVAPEYRRLKVGTQLVHLLQQRQAELGCFARVGYAFKHSRFSLGPQFWKKKTASSPLPVKPVKSVSLWARVFEPRKVAAWSNKPLERWGLSLLPKTVCQIGRPAAGVNVRAYQPHDLSACESLINQQARQADLAILWTPERLSRQLQFGTLAHTLVVEQAGQVTGFLNYHLLDMFMNGKLKVAVIDLLAHTKLTGRQKRALINSALLQMQQQGAELVLMREFASQPRLSLLRSQFLPQWPESLLLMSYSQTENVTIHTKVKKVQLLWR
jgi:GNAT superfamily N-acetyltransferase